MAKIIIVGSEKGGAGKSTLINALTANENVFVVDTDPQGDLFKLLGKEKSVFAPITTKDDDDLGESVASVLDALATAIENVDEDATIVLNTAGGVLTHLNPSAELIGETLNEISPEWKALFIVTRADSEVPALFDLAPQKIAAWATKEAAAPENWGGAVIPKLNKVSQQSLTSHPATAILTGAAGVPLMAKVAVKNFCKVANEIVEQ